MRFVTRILIGLGAASLLAVAAPAAANAATPETAPAKAPAWTAPVHEADWGPYFSSDHKAETYGHVEVNKKKYKKWYWDTEVIWKKKCFWHKGKKHCKPYKKIVKVKKWKWAHRYTFEVTGTLENHKWWGYWKYRCAWATFKVTEFDGDTYYRVFDNCKKHPAEYWFGGKNAKLIQVKVAKGNRHHPKGKFSAWETVYAAV